MNKTYLLALVSFLSISTLSSAAPLRSRQAKSAICSVLVTSFSNRGVTSAACLGGDFNVTEEKHAQVGQRNVSTLLKVSSAFDDKSFDLTLKKRLSVSDSGTVVVGTWGVDSVDSENLGRSVTIENSNVGDANVKNLTEVEYRNAPAVFKAWSAYAEAPDYDLESIKSYKILGPNGELIGYITEEGTSSQEAGLRVLVTAKFDARGDLVGEPVEESWGIDE